MEKELEIIDVLFDWVKSHGRRVNLLDLTIRDLRDLEMLLKANFDIKKKEE